MFLNPGDYLPLATKHSLRNILDRLLLVVQTAARKMLAAFGPGVVLRPGYRKGLIEASIVTNAALAAYSIQQEFGGSEPTDVRTVYGVYLLETREIWAPCLGNPDGVGLAAAPQDLGGFVDLGEAIVQSRRITSYWAVWSIDRLLEPDRKILIEVCLLRPLLADEVARDIICVFVREHRGVEHGANGHVVHCISCGGQKAAHSGADVVAVGTPERWELIPRADLGGCPSPSEPWHAAHIWEKI